MDSGYDRSLNQPGVSERQKIEVIMNQVKIGRTLEDLRNMKTFSNLRVNGRILGIRARTYSDQLAPGSGIPGGEKRNIQAQSTQLCCEQAHDVFPRAVMAGRGPP